MSFCGCNGVIETEMWGTRVFTAEFPLVAVVDR
jgi:hypothetical protein